ncbi:alpha-amylase [Alteromonas oceanisediminis]|uniref:alpha-amylase n=1 Tax=Alteromonas oceanisediminis TaxID=2836180 RepID=UPI001BD9D729|nr:alpha-amylase family protein [Alteromonas oceanisediminis]MBT0586271.1 alpha-amylase family protein [Alteromonas oceanisediminis]
MKHLRTSLTAGALLASLSHFTTAAPTTFVHLFEWSWPDIATECETFLGPKGYAAVQVSPPNEHIDVPQWWARYQPVSYVLESRGGDRAAFIDMVQRCDAAGVDIYVDAVINHMAAGSGTGTAGSTFANKQYPIYSPQDFHSSCSINDYGNRWQVQHCELVGLADLDTDAPYVRNTLTAFLNDLISIGVKGFRFDASKHMPSNDISAIVSQLNGSPLVFQEVIDQGGEAVSASEYVGNGLVTEFKYSVEIGNTFRNGQLAWLSNFGEGWGFMPSSQAVVFVDNHDNQRGHGGGGNVITFEDGRLYDLANVFMLAYPYGYPKVMSSYDFHGDTDAGGPSVPVHNNGTSSCFGSQWQCEHRWSYIAGAMDFRNNTSDAFYTQNWWSNGGNQIAFSRGSSGFVAINKEQSWMTQNLASGLSAGTYCNVLKGELSADGLSCSGDTVTVSVSGLAQLNIAPWDAVAIHKNAKISGASTQDWQRTVVFVQAQTASGQDMFVRGGIDHSYAASALGKSCTDANRECAIPIRHNNLRNSTTAPWKASDSELDWYGVQAGQSTQAEGTALDWTTNAWPAAWGAYRSVANDGYGEEPLNQWGDHFWMLDVDMDCSQTANGWFELKAFVKNGQGWENDVQQPGAPYASTNHLAQCGKVNRFTFNQDAAVISDF